MLYRTYKN